VLFAALSGPSATTVVPIGSIRIPATIAAGYDKHFTVGVIATCGLMSLLLPPSIPMIVYADAVQESVGQVFMAGIIPGIVAGIFLVIITCIVARRRHIPGEPRQSLAHPWRTFRRTFWGLLLIVIVVGGSYGAFTPTEARGPSRPSTPSSWRCWCTATCPARTSPGSCWIGPR
jgi:C4-dicarboxylate transporter DctM subunit